MKASQHLARTRPISYLGALVCIFLMATWTGCGGCSSSTDKVPSSPEARVEQMANRLPASTDVALISGDLATTRAALNKVTDRAGKILPMVPLAQKQIQNELGINILSEQSWAQAGVAANSGFTLALVQNRPVLLTYVDDRQAFESTFVDRLKKTFDIDAPVRTEKAGEVQLKIVSKSPSLEIAWFYDGKLAVVALPAFDNKAAMESGSATLIATQIAQTKKGTSMGASAPFQQFRKATGKDEALSVYVNTKSLLASDAVTRSTEMMQDGPARFVAWAKDNAEVAGLRLDAEGDQIKLRGFVTPNEALLKRAKEAQSAPSKVSWEHFATDKTMLAGRMSLDFQKLWTLYLESLPENDRGQLRRELKMLGRSINIDVEDDILTGLTGNGALFFYGVDIGTLMMAMNGDMNQAFRAVGVIVSLQFVDEDRLQSLIQKLNSTGLGMINLRQLIKEDGSPDDSIQVMEVKNLAATPGALYIKGDTLTFATAAFGEHSVYQYLTDSRDDGRLKDEAKLDLGKRFATEDGLNGLYLNFLRANDHLGSTIPIPMVKQTLGLLEELLIDFEVTENGTFTTVTLDLMPEPESK